MRLQNKTVIPASNINFWLSGHIDRILSVKEYVAVSN
jgi:hypothetical protein